jgi:hypothetical protein
VRSWQRSRAPLTRDGLLRRRQDELSEPDAALLVTLISADGRAVLHREPLGGGYPRGERGASDLLRVPAPPDFGAPAAVWLAPERGTWRVDACAVSVDGGEPLLRYLAAPDAPGFAPGSAATELLPAGSAAFPRRTRAQRAAARAASMAAYEALKTRLLGVTAALALPGAALAAKLGGTHAAAPFAVGAAAGLLYLLLLERGVDALPGADDAWDGGEHDERSDASAAPDQSAPPAEPAAAASGGVGGTGAGTRLALVALAALVGARQLASGSEGGAADVGALRVELAAGAAGFLLYKLAVLVVGLAWPQDALPPGAAGENGDEPPPPPPA